LEEENLIGSLAYAAHLKASGEKVKGAIVLECVGFTNFTSGSQQKPPGIPIAVPSRGDFLAIVGNTASAELVVVCEQAAKRVHNLKTVSFMVPAQGEHLPDTRRSDHAAFWHYGYPSVMLTDTANFRNPHYHQPTDTIETLDFTFMDLVTHTVVESAIHLNKAAAKNCAP
jgi:aminopeptidase YwaD